MKRHFSTLVFCGLFLVAANALCGDAAGAEPGTGAAAGNQAEPPPDTAPAPAAWELFRLPALEGEQAASEGPYLPFLRRDSLRTGLYRLPAGGTDRQTPHKRDEVYYVVTGKSLFTVAGEEVEVVPGTVLFVAAGVEHRFHHITEDLEVLVFFGGAPPAPVP